jgi:predicted RNase H-like nuclease
MEMVMKMLYGSMREKLIPVLLKFIEKAKSSCVENADGTVVYSAVLGEDAIIVKFDDISCVNAMDIKIFNKKVKDFDTILLVHNILSDKINECKDELKNHRNPKVLARKAKSEQKEQKAFNKEHQAILNFLQQADKILPRGDR